MSDLDFTGFLNLAANAPRRATWAVAEKIIGFDVVFFVAHRALLYNQLRQSVPRYSFTTPKTYMLLFQSPHREVAWEEDPATLTFPLTIRLEVALNPPELFGEAEFTNTLREFPRCEGSTNISLNGTFYEGIGRLGTAQPVCFNKFDFSGKFAEADLRIQGATATFECVCLDIDTFYYFIHSVIERFASAFSVASVTPVSVIWMRGKANAHPFTVRLVNETATSSPFSTVGDAHEKLTAFFREALPSVTAWPVQVVAAVRYLSQSFLLESVSKYSYYFCGERILNVCKAIESLTIDEGDQVDDMRRLLRSWSVHERYIDLFVSTRYLRSQLDVAHVAYSPISSNAYRSIQNFLPIAEECTQRLILTALRQLQKNPGLFKEIVRKTDDPVVVKKLAKYDGIKFSEDGGLSTVS